MRSGKVSELNFAFRSELALLLHLPLLSTSNPPSHLTSSQAFRPERDSILLHLNHQAFYKILHSKIQDNYPPPRFSRFQSVASRLASHNVHSRLFWVMPLDDVISISDDEDAIYISDGEDGFQSPRKSQSSLCAASWWPPSITKQNFKMKIPFTLSRELSIRPSRS